MQHDDIVTVLKRENEGLREQVARLEEMMIGSTPLPVEWRLTPSEARVFGTLLSRPLATKEAIMAGVYNDFGRDEAEVKIVDVYICKIRKKLQMFGIEINTRWGEGYYLAPEVRQSLRSSVRSAA